LAALSKPSFQPKEKPLDLVVATRNKNIKATNEELAVWSAAALQAGLPLNRWIRKSLNQRAELEAALVRERLKHERG